LVGLAVFAVAAGWVGIPEHFPGVGGLLPNWFHEFVGSLLGGHAEELPFSYVPLLASVGVAGLGLLAGYGVYRRVRAGAADPLARRLGPVHTLLKRKYYFDELYDFLFVRPAYWLAETFAYRFLDVAVIDGFLHGVGRIALRVGTFLRRWIDVLIVNRFGDLVGEGTKGGGRNLRLVQTGRVQQYLVVSVLAAGVVLTALLLLQP
jgi:NADH-quinone oxidoreductase subunit L